MDDAIGFLIISAIILVLTFFCGGACFETTAQQRAVVEVAKEQCGEHYTIKDFTITCTKPVGE